MPVLEERSQPAAGSPDCVETVVQTELRQSDYLALRDITVKYRRGVLSVAGCVPSFYMKQVAITLVRRRLDEIVHGHNVHLDDRLEVARFTQEPKVREHLRGRSQE